MTRNIKIHGEHTEREASERNKIYALNDGSWKMTAQPKRFNFQKIVIGCPQVNLASLLERDSFLDLEERIARFFRWMLLAVNNRALRAQCILYICNAKLQLFNFHFLSRPFCISYHYL